MTITFLWNWTRFFNVWKYIFFRPISIGKKEVIWKLFYLWFDLTISKWNVIVGKWTKTHSKIVSFSRIFFRYSDRTRLHAAKLHSKTLKCKFRISIQSHLFECMYEYNSRHKALGSEILEEKKLSKSEWWNASCNKFRCVSCLTTKVISTVC